MSRKIIHLDMDAFYASVEQRDDPALRGKPIVVGGSPESRGVVCTASYEARRFGVRSAMPCSQAKRLCPEAIFVRPRFSVYGEISREINSIFHQFTDLVEPLSLDEAYLDVTVNKQGFLLAREAAAEIKKRILATTGLTATAGAAPNKFLAKVASGMNKPDGLTVVPPQKIAEFLEQLEIRKLPGVGKVTEERMKAAGIFRVVDLQSRTEEELIGLFGKSGAWFHRLSFGEDDRPVQAHRERRSIGCEDTFASDLKSVDQAAAELEKLSLKLVERMQRKNARGRTLTLKVTYAGFEKATRSFSQEEFLSEHRQIYPLALDLLQKTEIGSRPFRLLGLTVSNLEGEAEDNPIFPLQLQLWGPIPYRLPGEQARSGPKWAVPEMCSDGEQPVGAPEAAPLSVQVEEA